MWNSSREFEATILIKGRPINEVQHEGQTFVEGRNGSAYELKFKNNSSSRVLVIPSVDGLNVLDGKIAGKTSPGYVIDAWGELRIPGWKVDGTTAAKFKFTTDKEGNAPAYVEHSLPYPW